MKLFNKVFKIIYFLFSSLIISGPALYNGYPIMYFDSSNYINQSISLIATSTNPIGYPLFIRAFSWQFSLWPVIFAQGLILSMLIYFVIKSILQSKNTIKYHIAIITILSFFSSMSWVSSTIMADIFTPISILSLYLLLSNKPQTGIKIFAFISLGFASLVHFSNPVIIIAIIILILALEYFLFKNPIKEKLKIGGVLLILVIASMFFGKNYNTIFTDKENPESIRHVLLMARMAESGLLEEFLDEHCDDNRYSLCNYKDKLPRVASEFVWQKNGVFSLTGGWSNTKEEYNEVLNHIFTSPKYISLFAYKGIISTYKQLFTFRISNIVLDNDSPVNEIIHQKFKHEEKKFSVSQQHYSNLLDTKQINNYYYFLCAISIVIIIVFISVSGLKKDKETILFILIIFGGILFNAAINGTFSNVVTRYQSRVNWLLILAASLIVIKYFYRILKNVQERVQKV